MYSEDSEDSYCGSPERAMLLERQIVEEAERRITLALQELERAGRMSAPQGAAAARLRDLRMAARAAPALAHWATRLPAEVAARGLLWTEIIDQVGAYLPGRTTTKHVQMVLIEYADWYTLRRRVYGGGGAFERRWWPRGQGPGEHTMRRPN